MNLIAQLEAEQVAKLTEGKTIPEFRPGDTVIVNVKVKEGDRSRVQAYEGVVIARNGVLTIRNADRKPYALTIGATPLTIKAKSSASLKLPQRGTFSIVCAKWPSLVATVVVK